MKVYHARYTAMIGNRLENTFMARAGLGITGAFAPTSYVIDWKPGEVVDEARAQTLCDVLKDGINGPDSTLSCSSVKLHSVFTTER